MPGPKRALLELKAKIIAHYYWILCIMTIFFIQVFSRIQLKFIIVDSCHEHRVRFLDCAARLGYESLLLCRCCVLVILFVNRQSLILPTARMGLLLRAELLIFLRLQFANRNEDFMIVLVVVVLKLTFQVLGASETSS